MVKSEDMGMKVVSSKFIAAIAALFCITFVSNGTVSVINRADTPLAIELDGKQFGCEYKRWESAWLPSGKLTKSHGTIKALNGADCGGKCPQNWEFITLYVKNSKNQKKNFKINSKFDCMNYFYNNSGLYPCPSGCVPINAVIIFEKKGAGQKEVHRSNTDPNGNLVNDEWVTTLNPQDYQ